MSFAALQVRTIVDISSSALPEPKPFGCRIARRSCFEHYQRSFRMPSVSLPTPHGRWVPGERTCPGAILALSGEQGQTWGYAKLAKLVSANRHRERLAARRTRGGRYPILSCGKSVSAQIFSVRWESWSCEGLRW